MKCPLYLSNNFAVEMLRFPLILHLLPARPTPRNSKASSSVSPAKLGRWPGIAPSSRCNMVKPSGSMEKWKSTRFYIGKPMEKHGKNMEKPMEKPVDFPSTHPLRWLINCHQLSLSCELSSWAWKDKQVVWPREFCGTTPSYDAPEFPSFRLRHAEIRSK